MSQNVYRDRTAVSLSLEKGYTTFRVLAPLPPVHTNLLVNDLVYGRTNPGILRTLPRVRGSTLVSFFPIVSLCASLSGDNLA